MFALCFCMVLHTFTTYAQEHSNTFGNTEYLETMQIPPIDTIDQSGRFLGQSFILETTSFVESISFAVIECYSLYDHSGTLTLYANEAFGEVLWTSEVNFPGLSRFVEDPASFEGLPTVAFASHWNNSLMFPLLAGEKTFEDVATTFPVNQVFDPGVIVAVMELDNYHSIDRAPVFYTFPNCVGFWCENPIDPYTGGGMVTDEVYNFFVNTSEESAMMDLPFEVRLRGDISTSLSELSVPVISGVLMVPDAWSGSSLLVTDILGREHISLTTLRGGETVSVVSNQVAIVTLTSPSGERKSVKVFVPH